MTTVLKIRVNDMFSFNLFHLTRGSTIALPGPRLAKRREILIFPRMAGNTGNSREILVISANYWEIGYSLTKKLLIYLLTAIQL